MVGYSAVVVNHGVHLSESLIQWSGSSRGLFSITSAILLRNRGFHIDYLGRASRLLPRICQVYSAFSVLSSTWFLASKHRRGWCTGRLHRLTGYVRRRRLIGLASSDNSTLPAAENQVHARNDYDLWLWCKRERGPATRPTERKRLEALDHTYRVTVPATPEGGDQEATIRNWCLAKLPGHNKRSSIRRHAV